MRLWTLGLAAGSVLFATPALAATTIRVTVTNLAQTNSVSFAPLRLGFNSGVFDSFDIGEAPIAPIISIAEGGSGDDWFPAFAMADPGALLGSVGMMPLLPGQMASATFMVDPLTNPFFTFGTMVVPSNDLFLGNDDPQRYRLFDASGNLVLTSIGQSSSQIWNAGSEIADPVAAAFLVGGTNALRTPENGVVEFSFDELATYNGLQTAGGYTFNSALAAGQPIYRIEFEVTEAIPEPASWAMMLVGFGAVGSLVRRRRRQEALAV